MRSTRAPQVKANPQTPNTNSRCLRPRKSSRRPPWSRLPPAQPTAKTSPRPRKLAWLREGTQRPDGRLPEVHGGVEGGGGLGRLLLAVAPVQIFLAEVCTWQLSHQCKYSS